MLETCLIIYFGIALIVFLYACFRTKQPWFDALFDALAWPIHLLTVDASPRSGNRSSWDVDDYDWDDD